MNEYSYELITDQKAFEEFMHDGDQPESATFVSNEHETYEVI